MMNKSKRGVAVLLLCALICSVVTACGADSGKTDNAVTESSVETTTQEADPLASRTSISDGLPDLDFGGESYRILTYNDADNKITFEESDGDIVNEAIYERTVKVEERFNTKIDVIFGGGHRDIGPVLQKAVNAGEDAYDLYAGHAIVSGGVASSGVFLNWYEVPYVDFTKPWWSQNSVEALTLNDIMFLMPSYMTITVLGGTYCMYLNKRIAEDYNIGNIYDIVNSGQWTLEKMSNTVSGIYSDLNGDSKKDKDDMYGLAITTLSPSVTFTWAFDMDIIDIDSDNNVTLTLENDRNVKIYEDLYKLYFNTDGVITSNNDHNFANDIFRSGNIMLASGNFANTTDLREFEDDYAIIPYPKYDEAQSEYYSMIDGYHAICGVPLTAVSMDKIGAVTEALTAESWKTVIPAYYDVALKVKGTRDEQSVAMLDLILDSVVVDFTYIYDNWEGYAFTVQTLLSANNQDFMSFVEKSRTKSMAYYEKVIGVFTDYTSR